MIEEVLPGLYRVEIPLPKNPLKVLNSYFIKDENRWLIIDTGMNREECRREMFLSLEKLKVDLKKTDFFITHLHADHSGLVGDLADDSSKVYFNAKEIVLTDRTLLQAEGHWEKFYEFYLTLGFPEDELKKAFEAHPGVRYALRRNIAFTILKEGDTIQIGDYDFRCIETPGHTPGHLCLYEAKHKVLVSGDHVLSDITPNIGFWFNLENPLKAYLASLEKVYALDVDLVLTGHRSLCHDLKGRIQELRAHHKARLEEVLRALKEGHKTTFQIAPHIAWDLNGTWELFPPGQKWFAVGETYAHVKYLEDEGKVRREIKDGKVFFSLV